MDTYIPHISRVRWTCTYHTYHVLDGHTYMLDGHTSYTSYIRWLHIHVLDEHTSHISHVSWTHIHLLDGHTHRHTLHVRCVTGSRGLSRTTSLGAHVQEEWQRSHSLYPSGVVGCGSFLQLHVWLPHLLPVSCLGEAGWCFERPLLPRTVNFFFQKEGPRTVPQKDHYHFIPQCTVTLISDE